MKQVLLLMKTGVFVFLMQVFMLVGANAQENYISVDVQSTRSVVTVDNILNTLEGANATFKFNIDENDSIIRVESLTGFWAGERCELTSSLQNGILHIDDYVLENLITSSENMNFKLVVDYVVGDSVLEMVDTVETKVWKEFTRNIEIESQPIFVWPSIEDVKPLKNDYTEIMNGDSVVLGIVTSGGYPDGWRFEWPDGSDSLTFEYKSSVVSGKTVKKFIVKVSNIAPDNKTVWEYKEVTFTVVIWPSVSVDIVGNSNVVLQGGTTHAFEVNVSGGNPDGYEYLWESGSQTSKEKNFSYNANAGNDVSNDQINVTISNYSSSHEKFDEKKLSYNVEIWPSASSSAKPVQSENVFYDENIMLEIVTSGGYTGEENGGWSFVWKRNGVVLPDQTTSICKDIVPNSDNNFEIYNYEVNVVNKYGNEQWYSRKYTFSVIGWQKGSLIKVQEDSVDVYHGSQVVLKSRKEGGFDSGWTYNWKADGTAVDNNKNEYAFQAVNTDNRDKMYQVHEYTLHATNKIHESIPGYECDLTYEIHVWPKCKFPSDININDETTSQIVSECIREGNTISLRVDDPLCGYWSESKSPWRYSWTKDDKVLGNDSKVVLGEKAVMGNGETKEIKTINYGLTIDNLGPNNHVWDSKKYKKAVSIYRKPATPTKLYKKGNGNSCTLIAESSISDDKLDDYEYFLVFGYTDPNGKEVSEMPVRQSEGTTRYDKISSSAFQNSNNRFWVYAMWKYEDGSQVTSGKCYLDGSVDEDFDGSVFKNNTRGFMDDESTAIEDVRCDVSVDNNAKCLNINQGCPSQVSVSVYNISGTLIRQDKFENVTSLAYRYDLPKGLYIINVKSSSIQTNKKVLIP